MLCTALCINELPSRNVDVELRMNSAYLYDFEQSLLCVIVRAVAYIGEGQFLIFIYNSFLSYQMCFFCFQSKYFNKHFITFKKFNPHLLAYTIYNSGQTN